ncbi:MAG: EF-hand domain-containing protein [Sulfuriferula sp.]
MSNAALICRNKTVQTFLLGTALVICGAGIGHAATAPKTNVSPAMALFDTNHDGSVSSREAAAQGMPAQDFKKADANHDGKLSPEELANAMATDAPSADAPTMPPSGTTPKY